MNGIDDEFSDNPAMDVESSSDEEEEEDDGKKKAVALRNADMFKQRDPTAGQLFVFVGKSERGKTYFMRWLIQDQMKRADNPLKFGLVFVKTKFKHSYDFVPDKCIVQGYNEAILQKYVQNLEAIFEEEGEVPPNFLVLDDLVGILGNQTDWFVNYIATFRHLNTSIFIAAQYLTGKKAISPIMREQTNFAFLFNSKTHNTIENLYLSYGQLFENIKSFKQYFFAHTEPRSVGQYVCMCYIEREDYVDDNYIPMRAPGEDDSDQEDEPDRDELPEGIDIKQII